MLLTRLLLLNKGTIQSHPDMGVGLVENYRYAMEGEENKLRSEFKQQIDTYLPDLQGADVTVEFRDYTFYIAVTVDKTIFGFMYDIENQNLKTQYSSLSDL